MVLLSWVACAPQVGVPPEEVLSRRSAEMQIFDGAGLYEVLVPPGAECAVVHAVGAGGGGLESLSPYWRGEGGRGGDIAAVVAVEPMELLSVIVGGGGAGSSCGLSSTGGGGGGLSGIFRTSAEPLVVAGGGGGASNGDGCDADDECGSLPANDGGPGFGGGGGASFGETSDGMDGSGFPLFLGGIAGLGLCGEPGFDGYGGFGGGGGGGGSNSGFGGGGGGGGFPGGAGGRGDYEGEPGHGGKSDAIPGSSGVVLAVAEGSGGAPGESGRSGYVEILFVPCPIDTGSGTLDTGSGATGLPEGAPEEPIASMRLSGGCTSAPAPERWPWLTLARRVRSGPRGGSGSRSGSCR